MLLPIDPTSLRAALMGWFHRHGVRPNILGEFQDSALLMVFGRAGEGICAAPTVLVEEILAQHRLALVAEV